MGGFNLGDEWNKFTKSPTRQLAALATNGASEQLYATGQVVKDAVKKSMPDTPELEKAPDAPTEDDPGISLARNQEEERSRRGRASTILSGASSTIFGASSLLSGSGGQGSIARRTLSGY